MKIRSIFAIVIALIGAGGVAAQDVEPTPLIINLSPAAPAQVQEGQSPLLPTETRTPTPPPANLVQLEAREFANVRAEPSTDSAQLGTIRVGDQYNVIGRYVSWIQFQFPASPNGRGWVYGELVDLTGDIAALPELDPFAAPAADDAALSVDSTLTALEATPGGVLTATADAQSVIENPEPLAGSGVMPTFTYPPNLVAMAPTQASQLASELEAPPALTPVLDGGIPPIVPILVLGGLGLVGLAISALRGE